jgi:hypothetical protein
VLRVTAESRWKPCRVIDIATSINNENLLCIRVTYIRQVSCVFDEYDRCITRVNIRIDQVVF